MAATLDARSRSYITCRAFESAELRRRVPRSLQHLSDVATRSASVTFALRIERRCCLTPKSPASDHVRAHTPAHFLQPRAATMPTNGSRTHASVEKSRTEPPAVCTLAFGVCGARSSAPARPRSSLAVFEVVIVTKALNWRWYMEVCTREQIICGSMRVGARAHLAGVRLETSVHSSYCASACAVASLNHHGWTAWAAHWPVGMLRVCCARSVLCARGLGGWACTTAENDRLGESFRTL